MTRLFPGAVLRPKSVLCAWMCAVLLLATPLAASAEEVSDAANEGGLGVSAALASLIYGPVKIVYSLGGTVVAGFAYVFSAGDSEVANTVLVRAVRGTYVITPAALRGEEEIQFIGRSTNFQASQGPDAVDVAAPPAEHEDAYGW